MRIMATCHEMGICTVAVYSDVDSNAQHVHVADEAYLIGPAPAAQSYLRIDTILEIAQKSGAEAIHPGYGFLSENAAFVEACERAGIVFIGPSAQVMRVMGSKIAAKQLAQAVDVPTVPGYTGASQNEDTLLAEAQHIGYPLLIKASAGGGGKGMREVHKQSDFLEQLAGARREAKASFGDETVFLEKLILQPRHVEIQILGDTHGNLIHLGERDCSIQRRHQKILEESPSPALTPDLRAEMGAAAVRIAKAAGYVNAGTMEFILDIDKHFYFLEMNTRLQVEHPVTEEVTGLDLVRHQLLIAAGEPLGIPQDQVSHRGHAIEVRLYAEDPAHNFLPSTGTISTFVKPEGPGIRVDSGINTGDEITQFYDPMIAKLIVYGEDRSAAIARLQRALEHCILLGVTTNIPLLYAITQHPAFLAGHTHTGFLGEHSLLQSQSASPPALPEAALIAAAVYEVQQVPEQEHSHYQISNPWQTLGPWRMIGDVRTITYQYHTHTYTIALANHTPMTPIWTVQVGSQPAETITAVLHEDGRVLVKRGATQVEAYVRQSKHEIQVALQGRIYHLERRQALNVDSIAHGNSTNIAQKTLTAPMAGTIVKVQVHEGEAVEAQQVLVILSAMKMEHAITASHEGKVRRILYQEGNVVKGGAVVVEME